MLVKLKGYFNQEGGLLPPDTIISLPDEKAKALIENKGAEAYDPIQNDDSEKTTESNSKKGTKTGTK